MATEIQSELSLDCSECGESCTELSSREFEGQTICVDCYSK